MKKALTLLLAVLFLTMPALAETTFDGTVIAGGSVGVTAPFGGTVGTFSLRAGDKINEGETIASIETTKVYASAAGTVTGIFAQAGDNVEDVTARYGAVLFIAPSNKYSIAADIEKAYNSSATKYVNIGETVYIACTADGAHTAVGTIVAALDTTYTVETTEGELLMEETVNIYRSSSRTSSTRIGRGTVSRTTEIAIGGSGSVLAMHVQDGDQVERGQLLFETVTGAFDGLYATGSEIISDVSGIVASADISAGANINKGDTLLTLYPVDQFEIEISIGEYDLSSIREGEKVTISFNWDEDGQSTCDGTVSMISHMSSAEEGGEAAYKGYISFEPDETVRLGMTVVVSTQGQAEFDEIDEIEEEPMGIKE